MGVFRIWVKSSMNCQNEYAHVGMEFVRANGAYFGQAWFAGTLDCCDSKEQAMATAYVGTR